MKLLTRFGFALLICATLLPAGIVYDNGAPNQRFGYEMTHYMQADNLTVSSGSLTFDTLRFWTLEPAGGAQYNGQIIWVINTNDPGNFPHYNKVTMTAGPVSRTYVQSFSSGLWAGYDEYQYDLSIVSPVTVTAGTYWFSLHNGDYATYSSDQSFYWETTDNNGTLGSYNFVRTGAPPGPWIANTGVFGATEAQLAYQLLLSTPEPGTWALLSAGIAALAVLRRRR